MKPERKTEVGFINGFRIKVWRELDTADNPIGWKGRIELKTEPIQYLETGLESDRNSAIEALKTFAFQLN